MSNNHKIRKFIEGITMIRMPYPAMDKTISYFQDNAFLDELLDYAKSIDKDSGIWELFNVNNAITSFGVNTNNERCPNYLINKVPTLKKINLEKTLTLIGRLNKPSNIDIQPILNLLEHKNRSIRISAIKALARSRHDGIEHKLTTILKSTKNEQEIISIISTLSSVGTTETITHLLPYLKHSHRNVVNVTLGALSRFGDYSLMPIFLEHLNSGHHKWAAIDAISRLGKESEIEPVISRLNEIISKPEVSQGSTSELSYCLTFLFKFENIDGIDDVLKRVLEKRKSSLTTEELDRIQRILDK